MNYNYSCSKIETPPNPCLLLDDYMKSRGGKASYSDCLFYLNNRTNLTQIQVMTCLNKQFPNGQPQITGESIGIL